MEKTRYLLRKQGIYRKKIEFKPLLIANQISVLYLSMVYRFLNHVHYRNHIHTDVCVFVCVCVCMCACMCVYACMCVQLLSTYVSLNI